MHAPISQGKVFVGANDANVDTLRFAKTQGSVLDCLDESTGKRLWRLVIPRLKTKNKQFNYDDMNRGLCSSPTVDGDRVYVMGSRGDVPCLDIHGQADGKIHIGTEAGRLTVAAATREKKILGEVRFNGPLYATPVAANGTLYIATQRMLYAFRRP